MYLTNCFPTIHFLSSLSAIKNCSLGFVDVICWSVGVDVKVKWALIGHGSHTNDWCVFCSVWAGWQWSGVAVLGMSGAEYVTMGVQWTAAGSVNPSRVAIVRMPPGAELT